jgi:hypothetical protein
VNKCWQRFKKTNCKKLLEMAEKKSKAETFIFVYCFEKSSMTIRLFWKSLSLNHYF